MITPVMMSPEPQHYFRSYCSHCFYNFSLCITVTLKTVNTNSMFVRPSTKNSRVTDSSPSCSFIALFYFYDHAMENTFILLKSIWDRSYYLKKCFFWSLYIKGNPFQVYNWFRASHLNATFILVFWEWLCQKSPSSSMPFTWVLFLSLKICSYMLIILIFHWCKADSSNQCFKALTGSNEILFALL